MSWPAPLTSYILLYRNFFTVQWIIYCCITSPSALKVMFYFLPFFCRLSKKKKVPSHVLKTANTHTDTHIFFYLTQLKHSDMSGNTCALGMWRNQESGGRTAQEKAEWEWGKRDSTVMLLRSNLWSLCICIQAYSPHLPTSSAHCWWHQPRQRGLGCSRCIMWVAL